MGAGKKEKQEEEALASRRGSQDEPAQNKKENGSRTSREKRYENICRLFFVCRLRPNWRKLHLLLVMWKKRKFTPGMAFQLESLSTESVQRGRSFGHEQFTDTVAHNVLMQSPINQASDIYRGEQSLSIINLLCVSILHA